MDARNQPESAISNEVTILIAEDDDGHAILIRDHLQGAGVSNPMLRFSNGLEIWNFLARTGPDSHRQEKKPYLLLLDIRMPKMDGIEVLRRIKADPVLHTLPVIMLTTTNDPREVQECYDLGCNCYIAKPVQYPRFAEALRRLGLFISIIQVAALDGQH
ncbi:MAG: response regulator [Chloroflexota bacterium]